MGFEIKGLDKVLAKVDKLGNTQRMEGAMNKAVALVERAARENAPKDTGALKRSITSKVEVSNGEVVGIVSTPLEYAPYIEFGTGLFAEGMGRVNVPWNYQDDKGKWHKTSGQRPRPYMRPALNSNREKIKVLLRGALTND